VAGAFTLKGISKKITAPVKFTCLKDKLGQRVPNLKGDLSGAKPVIFDSKLRHYPASTGAR